MAKYCRHRHVIKKMIEDLKNDTQLSSKQSNKCQDLLDAAMQGKLDDKSMVEVEKMIQAIVGEVRKSKQQQVSEEEEESSGGPSYKPKQHKQSSSQKGKKKVNGMLNFFNFYCTI